MHKEYNRLCTPAKIYFVLTIIGCIFMLFHNVNILAIFTKLLFAFIWTYILNLLCSKGYKIISWILVLFPFILITLTFFGIYDVKKNNNNEIQQQNKQQQDKQQQH
jgi:phosphotransferase system  glucose/maltose/N-acetylglucosamine-specific IIC component